MNKKDTIENKNAVSPSRPLICSASSLPTTPDGVKLKHNLKMISLDEKTWIGTFKCRRCGFEKTMKAAFVCQ